MAKATRREIKAFKERAGTLYQDAKRRESISSRGKDLSTEYNLREIYGLYMKAGDLFNKGKDYASAHQSYINASRNTSSKINQEKTKEKIRKLPEPKLSGLERFLSPKRKGRKRRNIKRNFAIIAMVSLVGALAFSVFSLTGSVVQGLNASNSRWIGIILFAVGLVFTFLYNKIKK